MSAEEMGVQEQVRLYAKQLRVPGLADYPRVVKASAPGDGFGTVLLRLLMDEHGRRMDSQNARRLKQAGFPYTKTLEEMDLGRYSGKISEAFVWELATCQFVRDRKNIVMFGNPGRGKTHMAIGLGLKACGQGMNVLFKNAARLSTELAEARESYILGRLQKKLEKADVLILDEMGYVQFSRLQSELLFNVFSDRSERGSIIVTTNLPFSQWPSLFDGRGLVAAMVDRLTFNAHLLDMNGESYRLEKSMKTRLDRLGCGLGTGAGPKAAGEGAGSSGGQEESPDAGSRDGGTGREGAGDASGAEAGTETPHAGGGPEEAS